MAPEPGTPPPSSAPVPPPSGPSAGWSRNRIIGVVGAALVIVGAFLPWATADFANLSKSGIEGDGVLTLILAVVCVVAFVLHKGGLYIAGIVCAVLATGIGVFDLVDIASTELISVGIGMYVTVLGGIVTVVMSVLCRSEVSAASTS